MARRELEILQIVNPTIPVPPTYHGGAERIVDALVGGLLKRGHHVTLAAHPDSTAPAEQYPLSTASPPLGPRPMRDLMRLTALLGGRNYDIIHNHGRLLYLLPIGGWRVPRVHTFHLVLGPAATKRVRLLRVLTGNRLTCVSVSDRQRAGFDDLGPWETIYNGISSTSYQFRAEVDREAPLVFLGRIEPQKGTAVAIQVAKAAGRKLIIAGPYHADEGDWRRYFEEEVLPQVDGKQISYIGPVNDEQKNRLLGASSALLMPINLEEPFGMVMAEAMACGTPVLGFHRGAVPEVVKEGETGFLCRDIGEMVQAVEKIPRLSRRACRKRFEELFSDEVMVDAYEALYLRLVEG